MNLSLENLSFAYSNVGASQKAVLYQINLKIGEQESVGILGQSGSGKTTLIQHFNGLLKPTSGRISLDNREFWSDQISMATIRRLIGLVFQFPENQFFKEKVKDEIAFGLQNIGCEIEQQEQRIRLSMEMVGLDYDQMGWRNPFRLSAGEKRRVALASVLVMNPAFFIMDEPTAGLDLSGINMLKSLIHLYLKQGKSIVIVSHNMVLLFELVKRMIVLYEGQIVFDGTREELLKQRQAFSTWGIKIPYYFEYANLLHKHRLLPNQPIFTRDELLMYLKKSKIKGMSFQQN